MFKITVRNPTDYHFTEGSEFTWCLAIGTGRPEIIHQNDVEFELGPGEESTFLIGDHTFAFEGHGVIGVQSGAARGRGDPEYTLQSRMNQNYHPTYTFSVWDRSHYDVVHEQPKRLQKIAMWLTGGVVVFSLVQLAITIAQYVG
jgi:hypothetical protein